MRGYRAWFGAVFSILVLCTAVNAGAQTWPLPVPKNIVIQSAADFHGVLILWNMKACQIDQVTWCILPTGELGFGTFRGYDENGKVLEWSNPGGCMRSPHWASDFTDFVVGRPQDGDRRLKVRSARFATNGSGFLSYSSIDAVRAVSQTSYISSSSPCGDVATIECLSNNCVGSCVETETSCYCLGAGACAAVLGAPACPIDGYCSGAFAHCYKKNGGPCDCYVPDYPGAPQPEPSPSPSLNPLDPNAPTNPKQIQPKNSE